MGMEIYTIGFTQKPAREFFEALKVAGITRLIDVRLANVSQLAGFSKKGDLEYFLRAICQIDYVHEPLLAPTKGMLDEYKSAGNWDEYSARFLKLLADRQVETRIPAELFAGSPVLLCSEPEAQQCHRRLVAEYFSDHWGNIDIIHI